MVRDREICEKMGRTLKRLRVAQNMLQVDFAVAADLNPNHYSKIERGKVNIRFNTLEKLAKALNISVRELLSINYENKT